MRLPSTWKPATRATSVFKRSAQRAACWCSACRTSTSKRPRKSRSLPHPPPRPSARLKFALGIIGTALGFRASTAILNLPSEFEGINLREWVLSFGVAINAALYAIQNADTVARDTAQVVVFLSLSALFLFGMGRLFKRGAAVSSVFGILLAIGLVSSPGYAVDLRKGAAASIRASETVDDSVIAAGDPKTMQSVEVAGTVKGDLIVFGDVVSISGTVEGNVIVAARRLEISGTVGGSLMGVAQTVAISGRIARNLITVGDAITVNRTAEIAGNVIAAGREAVIDGKTQRDLLAAAAILDVRGDVGRNVSIASGQVNLGGSSHIGGNFVARVGKEENVRVAEGAVITGQRDIRLSVRAPRTSPYLSVSFYIWQIVRVVTLFVTGFALFKLFPSLVPLNFVSGTDWLKAGGVGFMTLVAVPVAAIIIAVTVIGLPIALISGVLYLIALYLAKIIIAEFIGRSFMHGRGAVALLVGVLLVVFAINLPWIGGLINFLLILLGLGAIAVTIYRTVLAPAVRRSLKSEGFNPQLLSHQSPDQRIQRFPGRRQNEF